MNMSLGFDPKKVLPVLRQAQPYAIGLTLIAVFAYTALQVNEALNVKAAPAAAVPTAGSAITFDKPTIAALKNLSVVESNVPTGDLGTDNPFQ